MYAHITIMCSDILLIAGYSFGGTVAYEMARAVARALIGGGGGGGVYSYIRVMPD